MPVRDGRKYIAALSCPCVEGSSPGSARRSGRRGDKRPHDSEIRATPAGVATGQKLGAETGATPLYSGTRCMGPPLRGEGRSCLGP